MATLTSNRFASLQPLRQKLCAPALGLLFLACPSAAFAQSAPPQEPAALPPAQQPSAPIATAPQSLPVATPPNSTKIPEPAEQGAHDKKRAPCTYPDDVLAGVTGIRASSTKLRNSDIDPSGAGIGLQFAGQSQTYRLRSYNITSRDSSFFFIGGGSQGFEGGIGGDLAVGWRAPVAATHGPFVRAGIRGHLMGNSHLYSSFLELPQLQLGYQVQSRGRVLEVAGRTGAVLTGRYNTGDNADRKLGDAFEVGALAAIHLSPVHVEFDYTRVLTDSRPGGDVNMLSGSLCGDVYSVWLCVDGRYYHGNEVMPAAMTNHSGAVEALYTGLTLGFGRDLTEQHHEPGLHMHN